ncbi:MAG: Zn-dependent oligopeptidase [Methylotenera sp.]|nr:Zn-dependent oligopeptidase [Oligoflexia bacterium]
MLRKRSTVDVVSFASVTPSLLMILSLTAAAGAFSGCSKAPMSAMSKTGNAPAAFAPAQSPGEVAPLIRSDYKKGELTALCKVAIDSSRARLDALANLAAEAQNFDTTLLAFETATADLSDAVTPLTFMGYVSPNADTNSEGSDCEQSVNQFMVDINTRKDIYDVLKDQKPRNDSEKRLISELLKGFEANGLKLSADKLAQMKNLKTQLASLESQFSTNLNNDASRVEFSANELVGLPADYLGGLKKSTDGSKLIVTTRESDSGVFLNNATLSETRRKWLAAYYDRQGQANTLLLEKAIGLRQQIAQVMGYSNWADYRIKGRMATDGATALKFLNSLKDKLASRDRDDIAKLLKFKQELDPAATKVEAWDINYLSYQLKKRDFSLDEEKIREYFPADVVIAGMFDVYSQLLGVHYTEVQNAAVWSPDVKLYKIEDNKDGKLIGYFYTDFIPRQAKYGHAAAFPLIAGRAVAGPVGAYSQPVASIVANLTPPSNGKPSLLSHDDVVTIFHEFGHIMHQTLTKAPYASISGSAVAQDFVEAPSQMLENWPWDAEILNKLSGHYLNHGKKLPKELLDKLIAARDFNQGYYYSRQLMLATLDMTYHTASGPVDSAVVYNILYKEMIGVDPIPGTHFSASFGHLMGGYDAGYYGYLWSEVYAADMFTKFSAAGLLSPEVGGEYRRIILESGNSRDAIDLLRDFLGREPNSDAFLKKLHL